MKINYFLGQWLNSKEGDVIFDGKKREKNEKNLVQIIF